MFEYCLPLTELDEKEEAMCENRRLAAATLSSVVAISSMIAVSLAVMAPGFAYAGLLGATVDVSARYPTDTTVVEDAGSTFVTNGVEYPAGSFAAYNTSWEIDVQDNQILITDATASGLPFSSAAFNGFVLEIVSGPAITSAFTDELSTIIPTNEYVNAGNLYIDFAGVDATAGGAAVIDFTTGSAVPEPATWAITLLGFAALGFAALGFAAYRARCVAKLRARCVAKLIA
jgi:hypothetical protein